MAIKTFYIAAGADGNFGALSETPQTAATRTDGWTVAKLAAAQMAEFDAGTKQASTAFSSTTKPASFLTGSTANAFKTPTALTGDFAATLWQWNFFLIASTASSQAGRLRMRVFKSVNADGSAATELTASTQVGFTSGAVTTSGVNVTLNWTPASTVTLSNEYLFFVLAWEITTASGSNSADVQLRTGVSGAGSRLTTSDFTVSALTIPDTLTLADATTASRGIALAINEGGDESMLAATPNTDTRNGVYTLGSRFTVNAAGEITHVRYYATQAGTRACSLWNNDTSAKLATASDTSTGAGWRQVALPAPVAVVAATTYAATVSDATGGNYPYETPVPSSLTANLTGLRGVYGTGADVLPNTDGAPYFYLVDVVYHALGLVLADSVTTEAGTGGAALTQPVADTIGLADSAALQADYARTIPDTVALADAQTVARSIALAVPDTVGVTDFLALARDVAQAVADSVALADLATPAAGKGATVNDTVAVADAVRFDLALTIADNVALTDVVAQAEEIHIADTLALSDLCDPVKSTGAVDWAQPIADTLALADASTAALNRGLTLADTVALADALASTATFLRTIADTLAIVDATNTTGSGAQTVADTVVVTDAVRFDRSLNLADAVALADQVVAQAALARTIADTLALADNVAANRGLTRALADTLTLADLLAFELQRNLAFADSISVTDALAFQAVLERLLADTLFVADSISSDSIVPTPLPPGWIDRGSRGRIDRAGSGRIDLSNRGGLSQGRGGRIARTVTRV